MSGIKVTELRYQVGESSTEGGISPVQKALREGMEWEIGRVSLQAEQEDAGQHYDTTTAALGRNIRYHMPIQVHGYLAEIDLTKVEVLVSSNRNHPNHQRAGDANLLSELAVITTEEWAEHMGTELALSANFFVEKQGYQSDAAHKQPSTKTLGLSLSEWQFDQPSKQSRTNELGCVALLFDEDHRAHIIENFNVPSFEVSRDQSAVTVQRFRNGIAGNWLVKNGEVGIWEPTAELKPEKLGRHARLAIGFRGDLPGPHHELFAVMIELQTAIPRTRECLVGTLKVPPEALARLPQFPSQKFTSDEDLESHTVIPLDRELAPLVEFINAFKRYWGFEEPLNPDEAEASVTVQGAGPYGSDNSGRSDERKGPENFSTRMSRWQKQRAWKIRGRTGGGGLETKSRKKYKVPDVLADLDDGFALLARRLHEERLSIPECYIVRQRGDCELQVYWENPGSRSRGQDVSVGVTLFELAWFMKQLGIRNAVNLDGSGTSAFIFTPPGNPSGDIKNVYHDWRKATEDPARSKGSIRDREGKERIEMYHLEEFLKPRPAPNHIGFRGRQVANTGQTAVIATPSQPRVVYQCQLCLNSDTTEKPRAVCTICEENGRYCEQHCKDGKGVCANCLNQKLERLRQDIQDTQEVQARFLHFAEQAGIRLDKDGGISFL